MLEIIVDKQVMFGVMGVLTVVGAASKCIVNVTLKRMVQAAGNMNKSNHPLMRLVRAKFEHACMVSDTVENVRVFVDKYLYEYKVAGMKLHSWRRLEKAAAGLCLIAGGAGAWMEYNLYGMSDLVLKMGAAGAGLAIFIYLLHLTTDENYRLNAVQNYMVDYLENVCLRRYEKLYQKEIRVMEPEGAAADFGVVPEEEWEESSYPIEETGPLVKEKAKRPLQNEAAEMAAEAAEILKEESAKKSRQEGIVEFRNESAGNQTQDAWGESLESRHAENQAAQMQAAESRDAESRNAQMQAAESRDAESRNTQMQTAESRNAQMQMAESRNAQMQMAENRAAENQAAESRSAQVQPMNREVPIHNISESQKIKREKEKENMAKDVLIRQILEEFMA